MPGIYQNDKQAINLQLHQWVRPKQTVYTGDLGLIEAVFDDKVILRLIPRLDYSKDKNKDNNGGKGAKNKFNVFKPPQRIFNKSLVPQMDLDTHRSMPGLDNLKNFDYYKK